MLSTKLLTIAATFKACNHAEFNLILEILCKAAGGGIPHSYCRISGSEYVATFYYPTNKSAGSGFARLQNLKPEIESLVIKFEH